MQAGQPIIVHVVDQSAPESTTIGDVLIGAIGLTGLLILVAALLGGLLGAILIAIKRRRARTLTPDEESDTIHISPYA